MKDDRGMRSVMDRPAGARVWRRAGFSLIEVNMAILMVSVGLLTLFSLFPLGLRESEMGIEDTQEAMFADHVLSGVEGVAADITDWNQWRSIDAFADALGAGLGQDAQFDWIRISFNEAAQPHKVRFPKVLDAEDDDLREMRYRLIVSGNGALKTIQLKIKSGSYGQFEQGQDYTTQVVYMGM